MLAPQDTPPPSLFVSRSISLLKSQKAPKCEVQSMTDEEVGFIPKELLEFSNYIDGNLGNMCRNGY